VNGKSTPATKNVGDDSYADCDERNVVEFGIFTDETGGNMGVLETRTSALTYVEAAHLARRVTFHPTRQRILSLVGKTPMEALNILLEPVSQPTPPTWWQDPAVFVDFSDAARKWPELQRWWVGHVLTTTSGIEKMVAFWHNHFTSDYITVYFAQFLVRQNRMFRENPWLFTNLSESIVGDPAMLIYLNGNQSVKGNPNENFAREWFELFSMGVGNYSEQDIVEASRAFTGWRVTTTGSSFSPQLFDAGEKTILGQTGTWGANDVIRITLQHPATAQFMARKIYRTFAATDTDDNAVVAELADKLVASNFNVRTAVAALVTSEWFYSTDIRGALIKSPLDLIIGLLSTLNISSIERRYVVDSLRGLTQEPFYPPTVEGWKGHHAWITSSTFPLRQRWAEALIAGRQFGTAASLKTEAGANLKSDLAALVRTLPDANDPSAVVRNVAELLLPLPLTQEQQTVLLEILLAGALDYEWNIEDDGFVTPRLGFLFTAIVRMPEFQLM